VSQFFQSLALAGIALRGSGILLIFGLWGLVNSVALLSSSILARQSALLWHGISVGYVLVWCLSPNADVQHNYSVLLLALLNLAVAGYLAKTLSHMWKRNKL
jgi:hypothetical protein